ncbi:lysosomal acid glucosylceramidase-like [Amblyomma americanum]
MTNYLLIAAISLAAAASATTRLECQPRDYGYSSFVCVCNATYCDSAGDIGPLPSGGAIAFESGKEGLRFAKTTIPFGETTGSTDDSSARLVINTSITYQEVFGFGGAFTDAAMLNIKSLPSGMRDDILKSYYSKEGIEYTIGRIPIAGCDFSVREYTYDESPGDFQLSNFTLAPEDLYLKIPYIKKAMSLSSEPIWLFGSAWTSPEWMKTDSSELGAILIGEPGGPYYETWAKYYVRFVQEYEKRGVPIWGLTAQNEPTMAAVAEPSWQTLGFTAATQRDFVKLDLGPALEKAGYGPDKLKIMVIDDNRQVLRQWPGVILGDPEASKYVHGVAVHWYTDRFISPQILDEVHESFPDKFILGTEACNGVAQNNKVELGSWERAELYATDILEDLNHWVTGWTDWNLALNTGGGPNWAQNFVDSPIIVNATAQEFYKQPMYYALGHFSKFVPRGSVRIDSRLEGGTAAAKLEYAAFKTPDSAVVVIVLNKEDSKWTLKIEDPSGRGSVQKVINERSIATFIWQI